MREHAGMNARSGRRTVADVMTSASPTVDALDVILRDGSTLRLRPPREADGDALLEFFTGLSPHSLYQRFHGHPRLDERLVRPVLDHDWTERGALIAFASDDAEDLIRAIHNCLR